MENKMEKKKADVYEIINERIFELLEKGVVPWHKPWAGGNAGHPVNMVSKKEYSGINVFLLQCAGYSSRYWLSYKQAQEKGGQVRKGEKGFPVIFWKWIEVEEPDKDGKIDKKRIPFLKYYTVFNAEQCDGLKMPEGEEIPEINFDPIESAENIVEKMPKRPPVNHGGGRAYYAPGSDTIGMPRPETFETEQEYYSTLFHELIHSTGHNCRLDRHKVIKNHSFGSCDYSQEELVAEMGAAYLCGESGILNRTIDNSSAYIKGWMSKLKNDKKMLIMAAAQAQKAADFIMAKTAREER